jgi:capsular polysaccharide export protein
MARSMAFPGRSCEYLATSMDLCESPSLRAVLGGLLPTFQSRLLPLRQGMIVGWGRKWSGRRAVTLAGAADQAFLLLEDGFVRGVGRHDATLSLVFDDQGIYYDAESPSRIETYIATLLTPFEDKRARRLMQAWRALQLSKYNDAPEYTGPLPDRYVLVIDQVKGDLSVDYGNADEGSFQSMLRAALVEHPEATVIVKVHPDIHSRAKCGYFDHAALRLMQRVLVIAENCHPVRLIEKADAVYTVTSQVGFEALIWGKPVRCFGMPFYAGWGLTEDELPAPDRRKPVTLEQLAHAALISYPRYIDPVTMQRCEPEVTFRHVGLQRRKRQEFPAKITAVGFSRWKRPFIAYFLQGSGVAFARKPGSKDCVAQPKTIAVWGSAKFPDTVEGNTVLRIEDGFLRSSGLGANLVRPLSLVVDDVGIYYDATRFSRLEHILHNQVLDARAKDRASALRKRLVALDLTKYNLGKKSWTRPETNRRMLLVVGQVEADASIRLGSPHVKSNIELLRRVRQQNPSAYIIYKPHPDVVAGLRKRGQGEDESAIIADEVISQPVAISGLVAQIEEVHTMTSLLGFEALLRGARVVCHGLPFYAGWGLTEDRLLCPRRTRTLSLDELVYGALIEYPRYFNYERNCFVEPEQAVDQLAAIAEVGPQTRSWWRKSVHLGIVAWLKLTGSTR